MSALRFIPAALAAMLASISGSAPALAQDVAITNATLAIGDGSEPIRGGTVVVRGGKVIAAGAGVAVPAGVRSIDAAGKWVTPGLVVAVTEIGLYSAELEDGSNDASAPKAVFNAALDASTAYDPAGQHVLVARAGGVTRMAVAPTSGNAIFAGQGAVVDLGADPQAITAPRAFQYVELGEAGARLAGGSRTAAHTALRNALGEAQELAASPAGARRDDVLLTRRDALALVPVVQGRQPLYVHVERAQDIRLALALRGDFPALKLVLVGATEGWLAAREIAAAGVPVLATPLNDLPAQFEQLGATQSNVGRMAKAGVKVALGAFFDQPRYAPQYAGNLVALNKVPGASGLSWGQALAAITSGPAEVLGMGDRFGSLKPGRAGDLVVWDGDPLEVSSGVVQVFVDGVEQDLSNHQSKLRDRYNASDDGSLPKAYKW